MAYTKTAWKNGDIITADLLNKMEEGIASGGNASDKLGDLASLTTTAKNTLVAAINELKSSFPPGVSFNRSGIVFTDPNDPTKQVFWSVSGDTDDPQYTEPRMSISSSTSKSELVLAPNAFGINRPDSSIGMGYLSQTDGEKCGLMIMEKDNSTLMMGDLSAVFATISSEEKYGILVIGTSSSGALLDSFSMINSAKIIISGPDSGILMGDLSTMNATINDNEEKYGIMIGDTNISSQKFFKFPKITSSGETLATQEWVNNNNNAKMTSHHIHIKLTTKNNRIWDFWFIIYSYESNKINTLKALSNILTVGTIPISCQGNLITPDTIDEYMVTADLNKTTSNDVFIHYSTNKQFFNTFQLDQSATVTDVVG